MTKTKRRKILNCDQAYRKFSQKKTNTLKFTGLQLLCNKVKIISAGVLRLIYKQILKHCMRCSLQAKCRTTKNAQNGNKKLVMNIKTQIITQREQTETCCNILVKVHKPIGGVCGGLGGGLSPPNADAPAIFFVLICATM